MGRTGLLKQISSNRQAVFGLFGVAVMVLMTFYSAIAAAAPITVMSITPSTASVDADATTVSYQVEFTPDQTAGAFVIDFCTETPLIGQTCTGPTGMDVSGAATATGGVTMSTDPAVDANTIIASKTMTADAAQTITFTGLTNPTSAGVVYARIITYATLGEAEDYLSADPNGSGDTATVLDNGSVSMYFNEDVNVTGTVLETMTFCVSGADIAPNCSGASTPVISLGEDQGGGILALVPGTVSTGALHVQMNTNASAGAVVRLKSSASCGGLMRLGTTECDIAAAGATNVVDNDNSAKFGVKLAAVTTAVGASNPIGTLVPYDADGAGPGAAFYDTTNYKLNWNDDDSVGITSVFGDPLLSTDDAPATNQNMALTFAASVGTNTPAGTYSTDLNLIAVGKF